jgi:hypothetical protein
MVETHRNIRMFSMVQVFGSGGFQEVQGVFIGHPGWMKEVMDGNGGKMSCGLSCGKTFFEFLLENSSNFEEVLGMVCVIGPYVMNWELC